MRPVADKMTHLSEVLDAERAEFSVRRVGFSETDDWKMTSGGLVHKSGGFFNLVGLREPGQSDRVFLYQPQAAIIGLITAVKNGSRYFLIQARAEPGNPNAVQFGPTVQATAANYMGRHGGSPTPYIKIFLQHCLEAKILADTSQFDLGERYFYKTKRAVILELPEFIAPAPSFIWVKDTVLIQAATRDLFFNPDLRTLLSLFPWSQTENTTELRPKDAQVRKSLSAPLRTGVLGQVFAQTATKTRQATFIPLDQMAGWSVDRQSIFETSRRQGISVEMFVTQVRNREVKKWTQPLILAQSEGKILLVFRKTPTGLEFYVTFAKETGLASPCGIGPSFVAYPGSNRAPPQYLSESCCSVKLQVSESDEGGRFYRNICRYQIAEYVNEAPESLAQHGVWLRLSELKRLAETSNITTIQLRGVLSYLLSINLTPDALKDEI